MADPFAFGDPMTQPNFGSAPAPVAPPSGLPQKSVAGTMIAPIAPRPTAPQPQATPAPQPQPQAPQPQRPATSGGNVDQFMQLVRAHESGGNDSASSGVANGRYQFTPATWAGVSRQHPELGLRPNDIWDGAKQDAAMRAVTRDYMQVLSVNGIPVTMPNMFMLHFLGTGGGPKFLHQMSANPNADAAAAFPTEAQYNPTIFRDKSGQPRTLSQVYSLMTKSFGGPGASAVDPRTASEPAGQEALQKEFSTVPQTPQPSGLKAELTEDVDLKPLPGMTPIKDDLKPLPGMTPIGDGLKIDYNAAAPISRGNPYAADAKSKPDDKDHEIIGVDPNSGNPIFANPDKNIEFLEGQNEFIKGVGAGVAQDITGPASLLPNSLGGGYAERANETLSKTGDPTARKIGGALPMLAPIGEIAGAAKVGVKAIEAGESMIPSMLKGVGWGAGAGALDASSTPTGKEGYGERLAAKAPGMAEEGLAAGLIGGIVPGAITGAKWLGSQAVDLGKFVSDALGKEARKAAEEIRSGISGETGKAMTAEEQKIAQAKVEDGAARAKQAVAEAQIKHLDRQQEKLRTRMQERVKAAQKIAERAGQNVEQAQAFAETQEAAVARAEESANKLAKDFAARETMPIEEFGRQLQETAVKDAEALKEERAVKSGFDAAVKSDGGRPSVPTKQFIAAVNEAEKRAVSPAAKSALNSLKETLRTKVGRPDVLGKAVSGSVNMTKVSIEKARRIVQDLDSRIEGIPSDEAHEITTLKDKFVEHMETWHPKLAEARRRYADLSRPLDVYRDTGALTKSVLEDPYSGRTVLDATKVVGALLNKTEASADALGRLVKTNPRLQDSARKFFNQRLVDMAGAKPTPSESQFANFLRDNRLALDRAGLTNEFKDVAAAKATQERIAAQAKSGVAAAGKVVGEAEEGAAAAKKSLDAAEKLKDRTGKPEMLKAQRAAPEEARKQAVKELADAASKQKAAQDIQEHIRKLDNWLDPSVARTGQKLTAAANETADWLKDKRYIDAAAHKKLLQDIAKVEDMNTDHVKAVKLVKQIVIAAVVASSSYEVGRFFSHRISIPSP